MAKNRLFIAVGLSLVANIITGPVPKEFEDVASDVRRICLEESGADPNVIERVVKGEFLEDEKLKCYLKCELDQFGLISKEGELRWDVLMDLTPPSLKKMATDGFKKCGNITGSSDDLCDFAYRVHKCGYENYPEMYFII